LKQKSAGGIGFRSGHLLFGEPAFNNGMIIQFTDREHALAWYHSPAYQELLGIRTAALNSRFRLVG